MDEPVTDLGDVGIVVIGRNEGERLKRCLRSLPRAMPAIYVDSGSTDDSVAFARSLGLHVIELDMQVPFTAARARNVGWRTLASRQSALEFVQFVDGDCELDQNWISIAVAALKGEPKIAAVFGRLRERFPERSIYNKLCDDEWNVPAGVVNSCGGIALFRASALQASDGFTEDLIAGEEPDLCLRLRQEGWTIRCVAAEMALHDAAITTFSANWKRTIRSGFAYAEHVRRHGTRAIPSWRRQLYGIVFWAFVLPATLTFSLLIFLITENDLFLAIALLMLAIYPVQILRIFISKLRDGAEQRFAAVYSILIVTGKFAQFRGVLRCWISHFANRSARIIEYKVS